jgi:hypothetical protein
MSINAYRIIDIKIGGVTFNLSRDRNLLDSLDRELQFYGDIHEGSCIIIFL